MEKDKLIKGKVLSLLNDRSQLSLIEEAKKTEKSPIEALKTELSELKNELNKKIESYNKMIEEYEETVPMSQYAYLLNKYNSVEFDYDYINKKLCSLRPELERINEISSKMSNRHEELMNKLRLLQTTSTPRPEWDRCALVIDGGIKKWRTISASKTSDQLVDVLLNEFSGVFPAVHNNFDELIYPYLTVIHNKEMVQVRNRRLNRRELGLVIKELWKAKINHDFSTKIEGKVRREPMSSFCLSYFKKKYNCDEIAIEWYFNLKEACNRFPDYEDALFLQGVLENEIDEEIYHYFFATCGYLFQNLILTQMEEKQRSIETNSNNEFSSTPRQKLSETTKTKQQRLKTDALISNDDEDLISKSGFEITLKRVFPKKGLADIDELMEAAGEEQSEFLINKSRNKSFEFIDFKLMFSEFDDGRLGPFLKTLKLQFKKERTKLSRQILSNFKDSDKISMADFVRVIKKYDKNMAETRVDEYCNWLFKTGPFKSQTFTLKYSEFLQRLENMNITIYQDFAAKIKEEKQTTIV